MNDAASRSPVTPRLSILEALNARLRHERLLFLTETLQASGHTDPVSIAVLSEQGESGQLHLGKVTLDGHTWHPLTDLINHESGAATAVEHVLLALAQDVMNQNPEHTGQHFTFLLPRPATTELAYDLSGHLYVPEGSVVNEAAPGQPLSVTLPDGQTFTVRAVIEGHTTGVQLLEGLGNVSG